LAEENMWHSLKIKETFDKLSTNTSGLSTVEAEKRLSVYGANELTSEKPITNLALLVGQFKNPLVGVLVVAALICFCFWVNSSTRS
jgi:magnesium-transporting ATPase (P-type)